MAYIDSKAFGADKRRKIELTMGMGIAMMKSLNTLVDAVAGPA